MVNNDNSSDNAVILNRKSRCFLDEFESNLATKKPVNAFTDFPTPIYGEFLALAGLETLIHLVDDIDASTTFDNFAVTVAFFD